uniref:Uncharacterized protein n=1 Tax=Romanomermis culicivorax TaxID=13658 RepID=A0A915JIT8_ROMCU
MHAAKLINSRKEIKFDHQLIIIATFRIYHEFGALYVFNFDEFAVRQASSTFRGKIHQNAARTVTEIGQSYRSVDFLSATFTGSQWTVYANFVDILLGDLVFRKKITCFGSNFNLWSFQVRLTNNFKTKSSSRQNPSNNLNSNSTLTGSFFTGRSRLSYWSKILRTIWCVSPEDLGKIFPIVCPVLCRWKQSSYWPIELISQTRYVLAHPNSHWKASILKVWVI